MVVDNSQTLPEITITTFLIRDNATPFCRQHFCMNLNTFKNWFDDSTCSMQTCLLKIRNSLHLKTEPFKTHTHTTKLDCIISCCTASFDSWILLVSKVFFGTAWMKVSGMDNEKQRTWTWLKFSDLYLFSFFIAFGLNFIVIHQWHVYSILPMSRAWLIRLPKWDNI